MILLVHTAQCAQEVDRLCPELEGLPGGQLQAQGPGKVAGGHPQAVLVGAGPPLVANGTLLWCLRCARYTERSLKGLREVCKRPAAQCHEGQEVAPGAAPNLWPVAGPASASCGGDLVVYCGKTEGPLQS